MSTETAVPTPAGRVPAAALRPARTVVRWAVRHGLPAVYLERGARRGDPIGRLLRDSAVRDEPYALYEELRARGPLSAGSLGLVTASHAVAADLLRSDRFGVGWDRSVAPGLIRWALRFGDELDAAGVAEPPSMLVVDPPDHTRFRRLVSRAFTPRATAAYEPAVRRTADALLDALELRSGGPVDLIETYAAQLPVLVIADLLGVPTERRADFLRWGAAAAATLDPGLLVPPLRRRRAGAARHARVPARALRAAAPRAGRRPGQPARRTAGRRGAHRTRTARDRDAAPRCRFRDDREPARQRRGAAGRPPRAVGRPGRRPVRLGRRRRGGAAPRQPGADHRPVREGGRVARRAGPPARDAGDRAPRRSQPRPGRSSSIRRASTSAAGTRATTSRSPPASTTASVPASPGWRPRSGCGPWRSGSRGSGSAAGRSDGICRRCGATSTFR